MPKHCSILSLTLKNFFPSSFPLGKFEWCWLKIDIIWSQDWHEYTTNLPWWDNVLQSLVHFPLPTQSRTRQKANTLIFTGKNHIRQAYQLSDSKPVRSRAIYCSATRSPTEPSPVDYSPFVRYFLKVCLVCLFTPWLWQQIRCTNVLICKVVGLKISARMCRYSSVIPAD